MQTITIGVPIYNVEKYLSDCIESLLHQTHPCTQILLVDDGSSDASGAICDEYAKKNARIRVVHQANQGVSVARNAMIALCETEYLWFVDGDDLIAENSVALLQDAAEETHADIICFGMRYIGENIHRTQCAQARRLTIDEVWEMRAQNVFYRADSPLATYHMQSICSGMFRVALLREKQLFFLSGMKRGQDGQFVGQVLSQTDSIACVDEALYIYRPNPGSITRRFNKGFVQMQAQTLICCAERVQTCYAHRPEMTQRLHQRYLTAVRDYLHLYACHAHNPASYRTRREAFLAYMHAPCIMQAMPEIASMPHSAAERALYFFIRKHWFFPLNLFYRTLTGYLNRKKIR